MSPFDAIAYSISGDSVADRIEGLRRMSGDFRRRNQKDFRGSKKQKLIRTAGEEREARLGFDVFEEDD